MLRARVANCPLNHRPHDRCLATLAGLVVGGLLGCDSGTQLSGDGGPEEVVAPVPDAATGGWRDSATPWVPGPHATDCVHGGVTEQDLLFEGDGLDLSWTWANVESVPGGGWSVSGLGTLVERNEGSGWEEQYAATCPFDDVAGGGQCVARLAGTIGDRIVGRMWGVAHSALAWIDPAGPEAWDETLWAMSDPLIVRDDLAYAVWGGTDTKIMRWDGTAWAALTEVFPNELPYQLLWQIWADDGALFVAGARGSVVSLEAGGWRVHDVPTMATVTALFGFSGSDVWVGDDAGGLFHYDGTTWSAMEWPNRAEELGSSACAEPVGISGMWGVDGVLFLHSGYEVLRWDGTRFDVLGWWPGHSRDDGLCEGGTRVVRLRGASATQVFALVVPLNPGESVSNPGDGVPGCVSRPAVLWWDGSLFHWI